MSLRPHIGFSQSRNLFESYLKTWFLMILRPRRFIFIPKYPFLPGYNIAFFRFKLMGSIFPGFAFSFFRLPIYFLKLVMCFLILREEEFHKLFFRLFQNIIPCVATVIAGCIISVLTGSVPALTFLLLHTRSFCFCGLFLKNGLCKPILFCSQPFIFKYIRSFQHLQG